MIIFTIKHNTENFTVKVKMKINTKKIKDIMKIYALSSKD